jgi:hypothetical protein
MASSWSFDLSANPPTACRIEDGEVEFAPPEALRQCTSRDMWYAHEQVIAMTESVLPAASCGNSINGHSTEWIGERWSPLRCGVKL